MLQRNIEPSNLSVALNKVSSESIAVECDNNEELRRFQNNKLVAELSPNVMLKLLE